MGELLNQRPAQRVRLRRVNVHIGKLADQGRVVAAEVDDAVVFGTALQLARVFFRIVGDQDALDRADHLSAYFETLLVQAMLQSIQALFFQRFRGFIRQVGGRSARSLAVDE